MDGARGQKKMKNNKKKANGFQEGMKTAGSPESTRGCLRVTVMLPFSGVVVRGRSQTSTEEKKKSLLCAQRYRDLTLGG